MSKFVRGTRPRVPEKPRRPADVEMSHKPEVVRGTRPRVPEIQANRQTWRCPISQKSCAAHVLVCPKSKKIGRRELLPVTFKDFRNNLRTPDGAFI
jgi:hypothetical protein